MSVTAARSRVRRAVPRTSTESGFSREPGRIAWPDAAKGFLIVLVVLWHASLWMYRDINGGAPGLWRSVGLFLAPLRMPLFFFISGYLARTALTRRLIDTRRRTVGFFWIYAIWSLLFLARQFVPGASDTRPGPLGTLAALLLPTSFWYLWALPVYFLLSVLAVRWLGRRSGWLLVPLLLVALASPLVHDWSSAILTEPYDAVKLPSVLRNLVWFYAGTQLAGLWRSWLTGATWPRFLAATAAYTGLYLLVGLTTIPTEDGSWTTVPLSAVALYAASQLMGLLSFRSRVAGTLQYLGRNTLPVYVLHLFAISAIAVLFRVSHLDRFLRSNSVLAGALLPPLIALAVIPLALLAAAALRRSPLRWMLEPPRVVVGRPPRPRGASRPVGSDGPALIPAPRTPQD